MMQVQIGWEKVQRFLAKLPEEINKEILNKSEEFMRFVQKSAKLRAPRFTGQLAESITVRRIGNQINLLVDSPYGIFQEQGFTPHWVHKSMGNFGLWLAIKGYTGNKDFFYVKQFKPFIFPALEMGLDRLPLFLQQGLNNAISKSRR